MYVVPFPCLKPFVLVPRLHNNLRGILQNPDRILKKVWPNMQNLLGKFRIYFQNKSLIFWGKLNCPIATVLKKPGLDFATRPRAGPGAVWSGIFSYSCSRRQNNRSNRWAAAMVSWLLLNLVLSIALNLIHHGSSEEIDWIRFTKYTNLFKKRAS